MSDEALREDRDAVAIVTLNRPDKLNAINDAMKAVIFGAVEDLRERRDLRALLIRAKGRFFTAGIDVGGTTLTDPGESDDRSGSEVRRDYRRDLHVFLDEMEAVEKPIVMAIHAPCLGVGVEMAGAVDFRLAAESARFGLPEIDLGVIAGSGGVSRFTRLCGVGWSKWLNVAGEQIDARTAQMAGFVQAVYPDETFEEEVWAFLRAIDLPATRGSGRGEARRRALQGPRPEPGAPRRATGQHALHDGRQHRTRGPGHEPWKGEALEGGPLPPRLHPVDPEPTKRLGLPNGWQRLHDPWLLDAVGIQPEDEVGEGLAGEARRARRQRVRGRQPSRTSASCPGRRTVARPA